MDVSGVRWTQKRVLNLGSSGGYGGKVGPREVRRSWLSFLPPLGSSPCRGPVIIEPAMSLERRLRCSSAARLAILQWPRVASVAFLPAYLGSVPTTQAGTSIL